MKIKFESVNLKSETWITIESIVLSIAIGFLLSSIFWLLGISLENSMYIGWSLWIIIYGLKFDHFWIIPDANHGIILRNIFSSPTEKNKVGDQRPIFKLCGKLPWEVPVGAPISLVKNTPIRVVVNQIAQDKILMTVVCTGALTAVDNKNLVWYHRADEKAVITLFETTISLKISQLIQVKDSSDLIKDVKDLIEDPVKKLFDGDEVDSKEEIESGRRVTNLAIESIDIEKTTQDILELEKNAIKYATAVETVLKACGSDALTRSTVLNAFLNQGKGGGDKPVVLVRGDKGGAHK